MTLCDQGRGSRGGGGSGGNLPPQLGSCGGAAPQLRTVNVAHFYFCLFLHVNLGLSQKIVCQIRVVFSFGQGSPWTPGDVCSPPPNFKVVPAPLCVILILERITDHCCDSASLRLCRVRWDMTPQKMLLFEFLLSCRAHIASSCVVAFF